MSGDDWKLRHRQALRSPSTLGEHAVRAEMDAIHSLVNVMRLNESRDYVSAPYVGQMLSAFVGLLSCIPDLGRLDAGSLDAWARELSEQIGYNLDREEML